MSNELATLKKQADEMGLAYHPNIGAAKLAEKIAAANADNPAEALPESIESVLLHALPDAEHDDVNVEAAEPALQGSDEGLAFLPPSQPEAASLGGSPLEAVKPALIGVAPAKPAPVMCTPENVTEALQSLVARGLKIVALTPEFWHIRNGKREDSGNMKMPLATLKQCAMLLMGATAMPTEDLSHEEILELKRGSVR